MVSERKKLQLQARAFRSLTSLSGVLERYCSIPIPQRSSFKFSIPATVGDTPGSIELVFYTPKSYRNRSKLDSGSSSSGSFKGYPVVINFHGGGFCIGQAADDERWATAVNEQGDVHKDAVVVSVDYRLAPEYPFPVAIEDGVSAILYIWSHAEELGIDPARTVLSGFSAGGNMTYSVAIRLHEELQKLKASQSQIAIPYGKVMALVSFYPSVDWTQTRKERDASNPKLTKSIPSVAFRFFDRSYLARNPDMSSPLLSPAVAPEQLLHDALPDQMFMVTCAGDQLLVEDETFRKRLQDMGKRVDAHKVEGVGHAWDKHPSFLMGNKKRDTAYSLAIRGLHEFWCMEAA